MTPMESQNQEQIPNEGWIDIARVGTFTPANGKSITLTKEDLTQLAKGFDGDLRRVPLVFGHPKTSAPAYGWVEALQMKGDILQARFKQVHEDVKTLVKNGNFKNISISISPDKRTLMHVGLLGAAAPAIDGLKEVTFNHDHVCIDFSIDYSIENKELKAQLEQMSKRLSQYEKIVHQHTDEQIEERIRETVKAGKVQPREAKNLIAFAQELSKIEVEIQFSKESEPIHMVDAFIQLLHERAVDGRFTDFSQFMPPRHALEYPLDNTNSIFDQDNPAYLI